MLIARKNIKKEEAKYKTDENGIRYTEEGYRIYTIEELNIGKGILFFPNLIK